MPELIDRVIEVVSNQRGNASGELTTSSAIDQDLGIRGDDAEEPVAALAATFGEWLYDWPWHLFIDFNEPPAWLGPKIWKSLGLKNASTAFPGFTERWLELGHVAAVIENGQWFDP
jgi:hypothetical protein